MTIEELLNIAEQLQSASTSVICDAERPHFNAEDETEYLIEVIEIALKKLKESTND